MDRIVGIALQTFLWICLSWLYFSKLTFSDTEKIIALIIFVIGIFIYFFEMMLNSKTFHFISQSRIIIKNKKELLSMITKAKLSVEILTKAFHYKDRKEVVSRSEIINYEFENVQDLSDFNSVDNMIDEMKNKLIIIDLDLRVIYSEGSNFKELDKCVESIKNSIKSKDKYFEVQTGYVLENLKKKGKCFYT